MLHPVPREVDKNMLAFAPVSVSGAVEVLESVHQASDAWIRMVNTLDDLADVLSDIDEGRF